MIEPFEESQVRDGVISYGLSSYGYDIRVADEFKIFTNVNSTVVDPKHFDDRAFVDFKGDVCIIPPNSFALARTVEYFRIPRNVLAICVGKSTYARCGIITNVTPFEPEWEGFVTLEISNTTPLPAAIYANEGIAQVVFFASRRGLRGLLRRQEGQVPGTVRHHAGALVGEGSFRYSQDMNAARNAKDRGSVHPWRSWRLGGLSLRPSLWKDAPTSSRTRKPSRTWPRCSRPG